MTEIIKILDTLKARRRIVTDDIKKADNDIIELSGRKTAMLCENVFLGIVIERLTRQVDDYSKELLKDGKRS